MDEALQNFLDRMAGEGGAVCRLYHEREGSGTDTVATVKGEGYSASWQAMTSLSGVLTIRIVGSRLPPGWYAELPEALRGNGTRRIELEAWGWWLRGDPCPERLRITDHIACRLASPLTRSDAARRGEVFVSLRGAYGTGHVMEKEAVLWHTEEVERLSAEEIAAALEAGCGVASPNVAPWAIGARAAGCDFVAAIRFPDGDPG